MNSANIQFLGLIADNGFQPAIVEDQNNVMYIGYCAPDCTGYSDHRWYIKRITTDPDNGTQIIEHSGGSRDFRYAWVDRANLIYKPTSVWE